MADRYRDRPFPADNDYDRGGDPQAASGESDPLAELARLIGQTDPFGTTSRANQKVPPRTAARDPYQRPAEPPFQRPAEPEVSPPASPPPWLQRANRQEIPQQEPPPDYPSSVHPLQRYAAAHPAPEPDFQEEPQYADEPEPDPSRYDDALYGQLDAGAQPFPHDPAYADDAYAYQDGYDDGAAEPVKKRRGGMVTVIVVLALAVVGTGAAFAYRTYVGTPRSGEPPIIKADTSPTKTVPAPSDGSAKLPDRMATGDGTEKIVPREEAPVDVNAKAGPRVVFPPLNQNGNPPSAASVAPGNLPPASAGNGTMPNNEPRKIRTLTVKGDQPDGTALPVGSAPPAGAKQAPAARTAGAPPTPAGHNPPTSANASANAPLSLVPQGNQAAPAAEPQTRVANTNPVQTAPSGAPTGGGYVVQVSSQRSEADAQASFRALQGKFPAVLGTHSPLIKRADLGEKGVYYRAMVGPFGTSEEASQLCGNLKSAGGQCVVQRN
ncbi:SPOR domain-containing protein [Bradyrhizobium sp.]|uniref:SPOR domain-containing protein n=1 Tax=Bradyrhizobium sp. TaxID=376 RepID=UPI0025B8C011|nr:SPOR domain-containing protein [Bradyrhizobium sp.]